MQGETERKKKKRRKKKSRFGYYLYAVVVLLLTVINITLGFLLLTHVQSIQVSGTEISQKSEIISWVKEDPMTNNSLYAYWKFKTGAYTLPVYLEDMTVKLRTPWSLKIEVEEKQIIGCIPEDIYYVYFDAEGLVLSKTSRYDEQIPIVEGIHIQNTKQFETIQVDNEKVFSYIVNVTKEIKKHQLSPDRIVWEDDSMDLYFERVCVKLGKTSFDEKVTELSAIIKNLDGKSGCLHLEHYLPGSTISFEENVEE